jgi:hypothetical protein
MSVSEKVPKSCILVYMGHDIGNSLQGFARQLNIKTYLKYSKNKRKKNCYDVP